MKTLTSAKSDGQKISKMKMEQSWQRQWTKNDAESMKSQKQEVRTNTESERLGTFLSVLQEHINLSTAMNKMRCNSV